MKYAVHNNSKNAWLVNAIIETEDLDLSWVAFVNALGDSMIEVSGNKEDLRIFIDVYRMVGGN